MKSTVYYGKVYHRVFQSTSKKRAMTIAHVISAYFFNDFGVKCARGQAVARTKPAIKGNVVMINHLENAKGKVVHEVFVKVPYDKSIKPLISTS